jgi:hypothetical protein
VVGHRPRRQKVGLPELPWRLWDSDLAFSQPRSAAALVGRHGLLAPSNHHPVNPPTQNVCVSFLD